MSGIKIAVIGSCVSRDGFNSKFIKNYKEFYKCIFTQNHMSMISLVTDPIPFKPMKLDGDITDFNKQILMTELTKSAWDSLKIHKPEYLILDFYADVYFGVLGIDNSYITDKSWLFKKTQLFSSLRISNRIKLENDYESYMELWKCSVDIFMNIMRTEFSDIKIIVNKIHFTDNYISHDGNIKKISESGLYKKVDVGQINIWLDEFYNYFEENYNVAFLEYDNQYYSEEKHIWNLFYVHYTKDFYEDFTTKLLSYIIGDLYKNRKKGKQVLPINMLNDNLLRNSTFNTGNAYWTYWQNDFKILKPDSDCPSSNILSVDITGAEKDTNRQIWSHAIEINTNGDQFYTISFDLKINNIKEVDGLQFVFSLRTYNKIDYIFQKDAVWYKNIKFEDIQDLKDGKWLRVAYTFKPDKGKFLKVGPYLIRNGNLFWRNIKLEKGAKVTNWVPSYREELPEL